MAEKATTETKTVAFDKFGFKEESKLSSDPQISAERIKRDNARVEKWRKMMPKMESLIEKKDKKLKERIRKGVPDSFRGKVWPMLATVEKRKAKSELIFEDLLKETNIPNQEDIRKDVNRTFPDHAFFAERDGYGQKALTRVLQALSASQRDMGYCQGLNYICGLLVLYCNDEEAFWILASLMDQYKLLDYYKNLECIHRPLFVLDELLKAKFPKLAQHLNFHQVVPVLYATSWFMTLYTNVLPFRLVVRLFDCFLSEKFKILYRVALAIFKIKEKSLLACPHMDKIMESLKIFKEPEFVDDDIFIDICFKIKLSKKEIEKFELKYDGEANKK